MDWELLSTEDVHRMGLVLIELANSQGWSPAGLLVVCREMARCLELNGVVVTEEMPEKPPRMMFS